MSLLPWPMPFVGGDVLANCSTVGQTGCFCTKAVARTFYLSQRQRRQSGQSQNTQHVRSRPASLPSFAITLFASCSHNRSEPAFTNSILSIFLNPSTYLIPLHALVHATTRIRMCLSQIPVHLMRRSLSPGKIVRFCGAYTRLTCTRVSAMAASQMHLFPRSPIFSFEDVRGLPGRVFELDNRLINPDTNPSHLFLPRFLGRGFTVAYCSFVVYG
ncbi:hypothetical protein B0H13DRAFT_2443204 [Mycena leptocephala]|nr:hypothetical protein B0H13DRAFT_2443204 [Mycena leptocephala]